MKEPSQTLRLGFEVDMKEEAALWQFINSSLFGKGSMVKESSHSPADDGREHVRISFLQDTYAQIEVGEKRTRAKGSRRAELIDLSLRGARIAIFDSPTVEVGTTGIIALSFLNPPLKIKVNVLG